ncbi:MAG: ABC transporter permease [Chloroflexi bacterium]|nr:ABC transporter permease [Chloroflexota bacterium]
MFASILGESLTLGAVGTLAGVGLGVIFGRAAVGLVAQTVSNLYFSVDVQGITVESFTLIKGVAVGLFASVGAAVVPAYDATRTSPAGAMRRSDQELGYAPADADHHGRRGRHDRAWAGAACAADAEHHRQLRRVVLHRRRRGVFHAGGVDRHDAPRRAGVGAAVRRCRPDGPARGRTVDQPHRGRCRRPDHRLSVIVGVSVMISSFRSTVADWLETTLGADIYISSPLLAANGSTVDVDPMAAQTVAQTPGVAEVSTSRATSVLSPDYPDMLPVNVQAVTSDIAPNRGYVWNAAPNGDVPTAMRGARWIVSEPFAFRRGITPERRAITLATDHGPQTFTIAAVYYDYSTDQDRC